MEETRTKLKDMYNLPEGTGIFLTSSDADAQFIPILITKQIFSPRVLNILTRKENLTAESIAAAKGEYYSSKVPIMGEGPKSVGAGRFISGICENLHTLILNSYNDKGKVIGNRSRILELVDRC